MSRYTATLDQPNATINVTTAVDDEIEVLLAQPATTGATTIAAASDGEQLPQATITVASTASLATPGATPETVYIVTTLAGLGELGVEAVTYTGKTGTTLTGCEGGTGEMSTGNAVTGNKLVSWNGVDRWLGPTGMAPVLQTAANGVDYLRFRNIGGLVYGQHMNAPGLPGPSGAPGALGFQNRGSYAAATAYVLNDIVTVAGSTYISIQAGTGHAPASSPTYWDVVALSGGGVIPVDPPDDPPVDPPPNAGDPTTSLDQPGIAARLIQWAPFSVYSWTDAQFAYFAQTLKMYGLWVGVPMGKFMGANWDFSSTLVNGPPGSLQEAITLNNVSSRARAAGFGKLYLGFYTTPVLSGGATVFGPGGDWFNDTWWATKVIPGIKNFAGAAKLMGFDGVGVDHENYGGKGTWTWWYPGYASSVTSNTIATGSKTFATQAGLVWAPGDRVHANSTTSTSTYVQGTVTSYSGTTLVVNVDKVKGTGTIASWWISRPEAQVRVKVKQRGAEMMAAMLSVFPNIEMISYLARFDGGFASLIANVVNGQPLNNDSAQLAIIDWWDGLTSVSGYSRIRFQDAAFYRGTADITGGGDLRTCMTINVNGELAFLSQRFSNWAYANQRVSISPMTWLGPSNFDGAYTRDSCNTIAGATSLVQNARIHGMSGEFANFAKPAGVEMIPPATITTGFVTGNFDDFTMTNGRIVHGDFVPVYEAGVPGVVDSTDPTLSNIVVTRDNATTVHATGEARDNLGVRAIRWVVGPNSGAATHTFVIDGGGNYTTAYASFVWHVAWTANNIPATAGQTITFVVEDIKGRAVLYTRTAPA